MQTLSLLVAMLYSAVPMPAPAPTQVPPPPGAREPLAVPPSPAAPSLSDQLKVEVPHNRCDALAVAEAAAAAAREAAESSRQLAAVVRELVEKRVLFGGYDPAAPPPLSPWSYTLGLSALAIGGNANSYSSKLDIGVDGHWRDWNAELRLSGSYGQTSPIPVAELQITASKGEVTLRGQRNYNPVLGVYLLTGVMFDRVASIAWQAYGEGGFSLLWWEHIQRDFLRSRLRTSLGFRATREHRYQYYPDPLDLPDAYRSIYGPTVTANFRFGMSRNAYFFEDGELYQDAVVTRDLRVTSNTGVAAQINQRVTLSVTYKVRYYGLPSDNKKTTDYELSTGISWTS